MAKAATVVHPSPRNVYAIHLKAFTTPYTDENNTPTFDPANGLNMALADLLSDRREEVSKALEWLRKNVRGFALIP